MKISNQIVLANWYAVNAPQITGFLDGQNILRTTGDLHDRLNQLFNLGLNFNKIMTPEGYDRRLYLLFYTLNALKNGHPDAYPVQFLPERPAYKAEEPDPDDAYADGLRYARTKREAAQRGGFKWYLRHQLALLKKLRNQDWWGKLCAMSYGAGVGLGLAGYFYMFAHGLQAISFAVFSPYLFVLVPIVLFSWFAMQQNFWISRKSSSELIFDIFTSPRETKPFDWRNRSSWYAACKEGCAKFLGLCNALIYGGLSAWGMWSLFTELGVATLGPIGIGLKYGITAVLGLMVFLPELGLGIKFNRLQLDKNPLARYEALSAKVEDSPNTLFGMNKYKVVFFAVFACVLVGSVFTALAAADMVTLLTGLHSMASKLILMALSFSVLPFYYDKALKFANSLYQEENGEKEIEVKQEVPGLDPSEHTQYSKGIRLGNAMMNFIPAFMGGFGLIGGVVGAVLFGAFTGLTALMSSYLAGEEGKVDGYDEALKLEEQKTEGALKNTVLDFGEPGGPECLTAHPLLFRPFHTTAETQESEMAILNGELPLTSNNWLRTEV